MTRKKWVHTFGATTACTMRLLESCKLSEIGVSDPMKRCVFADSWFASVKTVLALRQNLFFDEIELNQKGYTMGDGVLIMGGFFTRKARESLWFLYKKGTRKFICQVPIRDDSFSWCSRYQ